MSNSRRTSNRLGVVNGDGHVIGLDVGATAVRATTLAHGRHQDGAGVSVCAIALAELPDGAVESGAVANPAAVAAAVRQLAAEDKLFGRKVVLGITSPQLVVRDMTLPNLPPEKMRKALPFQAREAIALPVAQALLDFTPLGPPDPTDGTVTGLLVAAPREPIVAAVRAVERGGLQVGRVDLGPLGLLRAVASAGDAVEALVDIGAQLTTIVIHTGGRPRVVRVLGHGGRDVTDAIADQVGMPPEDAERAKRAGGLAGSGPEHRVVADSVRPLVAEIRSSITYFGGANPGTPVERVVLTGGGAGLPGLPEEISRQLGIPVEAARPFQHVAERYDGHGPRKPGECELASAVSVGLAMGAAA